MKNEPTIDRGDSRKYFVMLPVLIDDLDLDVYEYRLYGHLKRRAGSEEAVAIGLRSIAEHCGMSKPTVIKAKEGLQNKGLITVTHQGDNEPDLIVIEDIWLENVEAYSNKKKGGQRGLPGVVNAVDQGVVNEATTKYIYNTEDHINTSFEPETPQQDALISDADIKPSNPVKAPKKEPKQSTEQQIWFDAICKTVGWDYHVITKDQIGQVAQTVGVLQKAGYTIDDLRAFYKSWFESDWRGKQGQRPTLTQVRSEIGKLKADAVPAPVVDSRLSRIAILS